MAGQQDNRMHCAEFDALLSQAIDGTLAGERLTAFEAHSRDCKLCGPLLQEAEAGHTWLKSLAEVEPPEELVTNILLRTSGVLTSRQGIAGRATTTSWMDRVREWGSAIAAPVVSVARQPRFAMSFCIKTVQSTKVQRESISNYFNGRNQCRLRSAMRAFYMLLVRC